MPGVEVNLLRNAESMTKEVYNATEELMSLLQESRELIEELRNLIHEITRERAALAQQVRSLVAIWKSRMKKVDQEFSDALEPCKAVPHKFVCNEH